MRFSVEATDGLATGLVDGIRDAACDFWDAFQAGWRPHHLLLGHPCGALLERPFPKILIAGFWVEFGRVFGCLGRFRGQIPTHRPCERRMRRFSSKSEHLEVIFWPCDFFRVGFTFFRLIKGALAAQKSIYAQIAAPLDGEGARAAILTLRRSRVATTPGPFCAQNDLLKAINLVKTHRLGPGRVPTTVRGGTKVGPNFCHPRPSRRQIFCCGTMCTCRHVHVDPCTHV